MYKMGEESMEYTYKIVPYMYWQTTEFEKWLSDLALEGMEVVKIGNTWIKLKHIQPKQLIYKIMLDEESIEKECKEADGWNKVHTPYKFCLYVSEEEYAKERLKIDDKKEEQKIKSLLDGCRVQGTVIFMLMIVWIITLITSFLNANFIYELITGDFMSYMFMVFTIFILCMQQISKYRGLKQLGLRIEKGMIDENKSEDKKIYNKNRARLIASGLVIGGCMIYLMSVMQEDTQYYDELPTENNNVPIVRLSALETDKDFTTHYLDDEGEPNINTYDVYDKGFMSLMNVKYVVYETGKTINQEIEVERPYLQQEIYELKFSGLTKSFIGCLLERKVKSGYREMDYIEQSVLDQLYIYEIRNGVKLIASKGKLVIDLYYTGNATIDKVVKQVIQTLDDYQ